MHRCLLSFWILFFCLSVPTTAQDNRLSCELIVPISTPQGERVLSLERYPRIHVLLRNLSNSPVHLWKDWNTWGYFNLSLFFVGPDGKRTLIKRKNPGKWEGDFPDFWIIPPKEHLLLEIDMASGQWEGFPDLYGERLKAQLYAVYENKTDPLVNEFGIWTGRLQTKGVSVVFE